MVDFNRDPTERTQVLQHQTTDTSKFVGNHTNAGAFDTISTFFSDAAKAQQEKDILAEEAKDEQALMQLELDARSRPDEARNAIRTGDFSTFSESQRLSKPAVFAAAAGKIGQVLGTQANDEFAAGFRELPPEASHDKYISEFLKAQTAGMNTRAEHAFTKEITGAIPGLLSERMKGLADHHKRKTVEAFTTTFSAKLTSGDIGSLSDLNKVVAKFSPMPGVPYIVGHEAIKTAAEQEIMRQMGSPNIGVQMRASMLAFEPDPETGQTIVQRNIEDVSKFMGEKVRLQQEMAKSQLTQKYNAIDIRMAALSSGNGVEGDSYSKVLRDLLSETNKYISPSNYPPFIEKFAKVHAAIKAAGTDMGLLAVVDSGGTIGSTEVPKVLKQYQKLGKTGLAAILMSNYGIPKYQQDINSSILIGRDSGAALSKAAEIMTLFSTSKRPLSDFVKGDRESAIVLALDGVSDRAEAESILEQFNEGLKAVNGKVEGAFAANFNFDNDSRGDRAKMGTGGLRNFVQRQVSEMTPAQRASMGLGDFDGNLAQLDTSVRNHITRLVDIATVANAGRGGFNEDAIWNSVMRFGKGDFEQGMDSEGNPKFYMRHTPDTGATLGGTLVPLKPWTRETVKTLHSELKKNYPAYSHGAAVDAQTKVDGTLAVTMTNNDEQDVHLRLRYDKNGYSRLPEEMGGSEGILHMFLKPTTEADDDGKMLYKVPSPDDIGSTRVQLDERLVAIWNDDDGTWDIRANQMPARPEDMGMLESALNSYVAQSVLQFLGISGEDIKLKIEDLPEANRNLILKQFEQDLPTTWTDERLQQAVEAARAPSMEMMGGTYIPPRIQRELDRRANGGQRLTVLDIKNKDGSAGELPPMDALPDHNSTVQREITAEANSTLEMIEQAGVISANASREGRMFEGTPEEKFTRAIQRTAIDGGRMDNETGPASEQFAFKTAEIVEKSRGYKPRRNKNTRNVGYDFNLTDPRAQVMLEAVGVKNPKDVFTGKESITKPQAVALNQMYVSQLVTDLKKHFENVPLSNNQMQALVSVGVGEDVEKKPNGSFGPVSITPELTTAIRNQDYAEAARIIEFDIGPSNWIEGSIIDSEGFRPTRYPDAGGWAVGYGRNITHNPISQAEADEVGIANRHNPKLNSKQALQLMRMDIAKAKEHITSKFGKDFVTAEPFRAMVLMEMVYNLGSANFDTFEKMSEAIHAKDWDRAKIEMLDSKWATQVKKRASMLSLHMLQGGAPPLHAKQIQRRFEAAMFRGISN